MYVVERKSSTGFSFEVKLSQTLLPHLHLIATNSALEPPLLFQHLTIYMRSATSSGSPFLLMTMLEPLALAALFPSGDEKSLLNLLLGSESW